MIYSDFKHSQKAGTVIASSVFILTANRQELNMYMTSIYSWSL